MSLSSRIPSLENRIQALCKQGHLIEAIDILLLKQHKQESPAEDHPSLYVTLLRACLQRRVLSQAKRLQAHLLHHVGSSLNNSNLGEYLVLTLAKCGGITESFQVFQRLTCRTVYSWTAIISALTDGGHCEDALHAFACMQKDGVAPNKYTFVSLFKACSCLTCPEKGMKLHTDVCLIGLAEDPFIVSTLMHMYGKCRAMREAEYTFGAKLERDVVLWNAMLSAYVKERLGERVLLLYRQMQEEGIDPDQHTFSMALQSCGFLVEKTDAGEACLAGPPLEIGRALHAAARKRGFEVDMFVATALVTMYNICGSIPEAESVFGALPEHDLTVCNAMLSAYMQQGEGYKALELFGHMQKRGAYLDDATLTCILQACIDIGSIMSQGIHFAIVSASLESNLLLAATLMHAYGSMASMQDAQAVLDGLLNPDIVSWTACMVGHAREGNCLTSLEMFNQWQQQGMELDEVIFGSILSTCSLNGLVVEGLHYIEYMKDVHGLTLSSSHYNQMIDLHGRAGEFRRVENILGRVLNQANFAIWLSLLGLCSIHGNCVLGRLAFDHAVKLRPEETLIYVLMSNICSDAA